MMQTDVKNFRDYIEIVKRRKKSILLPTAIIFALAATLSLVMTPEYKSTSTILIEEQEIPRDYIVSTVAGYAEQRLQTINQRVMSATKLLEIINKYNLYSDLRKRKTNEEIIEKMRKDIKLETVSAEVDDPRAGRSAKVTIAFTISYVGVNPGTVQQISNVLASLYLEENLKVRGQQSEGAAKFFQEEMQRVQVKMADLDGKLAAYKERNVTTLPDLTQTNLQELYRVEQNTEQLNDQLKTLKEKEISLKTQLAGIPTDAETQEKTRLNELRVKLVNLRSRVSDEYPDVVKLKQEIAELEKKSRDKKQDVTAGTVGKADNLSYVTIEAQLSGTRSEIESVKRQIDASVRKRDDYRRRIAVSPKVEEGYKALFIERTNTQAKYDDLMKKYMEANVAQGLEKGQMGERFTLIDPARLPETPVRPNIPVFLLAGLVLGVTAGGGFAAFGEASDKAAYTVDTLARTLSVPLLLGIPEIVSPREITRRKKRRNVIIIATVLLIIVAVVAFNYLVMDLDVFWAKLQRRLSL
jgi:polysaccharide chain length determinant protein (PEP-CTERM system associated)